MNKYFYPKKFFFRPPQFFGFFRIFLSANLEFWHFAINGAKMAQMAWNWPINSQKIFFAQKKINFSPAQNFSGYQLFQFFQFFPYIFENFRFYPQKCVESLKWAEFPIFCGKPCIFSKNPIFFSASSAFFWFLFFLHFLKNYIFSRNISQIQPISRISSIFWEKNLKISKI